MNLNMDINAVKDAVLGNLDALVREESKKAFINWLNEKALPTVTDIADAYIARLKEDSNSEQGWNKFRDSMFLPLVISGGIWLTSQILKKVAQDI